MEIHFLDLKDMGVIFKVTGNYPMQMIFSGS